MVATWQLVVALHDACGQTYATAARLAKVKYKDRAKLDKDSCYGYNYR